MSQPDQMTPDPLVVELDFDDNRLMPLLCGVHNRHFMQIEQALGVAVDSRGNHIVIKGEPQATQQAAYALQQIWGHLQKSRPVGQADIHAALNMARQEMSTKTPASYDQPALLSEKAKALRAAEEEPVYAQNNLFPFEHEGIQTPQRLVLPRSREQAAYMQSLRRAEMVFGIGPAGTGKTWLAVAQAVYLLATSQVERILLSRPAVEAGEKLGFLPGDLKEKIDPYLRPLYDALHEMILPAKMARYLANDVIEIAPLAFMRGRTLTNAFIILDEAQNASDVQMRMFLTRLGENSRMVITGDISQCDLPPGTPSGLSRACQVLKDVPGIAMHYFTQADVIRHPLVARIVAAYDAKQEKDS